jgi:hypothetical protein
LDYDGFETISRAPRNCAPHLGNGIFTAPHLSCVDLDGSTPKVPDEFPVDLPEPRLFYWRIREPLQETPQR